MGCSSIAIEMALRDAHLAKYLQRRTVGDRGFHFLQRLVRGLRLAAEQQHLAGERVGDFHQVVRTVALETFDRLDDLGGVAGGAAERLVHRGEQGAHGFATGLADGNHRLG